MNDEAESIEIKSSVLKFNPVYRNSIQSIDVNSVLKFDPEVRKFEKMLKIACAQPCRRLEPVFASKISAAVRLGTTWAGFF